MAITRRSRKDDQGRKQQEAEARQKAYGNLSLKEKLGRLSSRPGECKRERARIEKLVESQSKKEVQE